MEGISNIVLHASHECVHYLVNGFWPALLLVLLLAVAFHATRRLNAASRYMVWWVVLVLTILLPGMLALSSVTRPTLQSAVSSSRNYISGMFDTGQKSAPEARALQHAEHREAHRTTHTPGQVIVDDPAAAPITAVETELPPVSFEETPLPHKMSISQIAIGLVPLVAAVIWLLGSLFAFVRLATGYVHLRILLRRSRPAGELLAARTQYWRKALGCRRKVEVRTSASIDSPAAVGFLDGVLLVPEYFSCDLSVAELDTVLIHELAHFRRNDDRACFVERVLLCLFFWHPLVHWIVRRIDLEREIACDDVVLSYTHQPRRYAQTLARLIGLEQSSPAPMLSPGFVFTRKQIVSRFEMILNKRRNVSASPATRHVTAISAVMTVLVLLAVYVAPVIALPGPALSYSDLVKSDAAEIPPPDLAMSDTPPVPDVNPPRPVGEVAMPQFPEEPRPYALASAVDHDEATGALGGVIESLGDALDELGDAFNKGTMITNNGRSHRVVFSDGRDKLAFEYEGDIVIADDDRSISSITDNGYVEIEERYRGDRHRLVIEPNSDGSLDYAYYEDGRSHDFDDDARRWYAGVVLKMVRTTGIGAEDRVERIRKKSGVEGVLDEIGHIDSDWAQRTYYAALFKSGPLTEAELERVLRQAAKHMDSDYEKAELLILSSRYGEPSAVLTDAYVDAVATIDSDYEKRRVLDAVVLDHDLDPKVVTKVLEIAEGIDSDYERAELLIKLAPQIQPKSAIIDAYINAVEDIDSDYETRRVLEALAFERDLTPDQAAMVLTLATSIDSDYERAELLIDLIRKAGDDKLLSQYVDAIGPIDSDYEKHRVLSELGLGRKSDRLALAKALTVADDIDSDYERASLLVELSKACALDPELRLDYIRACKSISSDYEMSRAIGALMNVADDDPQFLHEMFGVVGNISSDYEKAEMLQSLSPAVAQHDELEDEFVDLIESISSDYDRDRVLSSFYRDRRKAK